MPGKELKEIQSLLKAASDKKNLPFIEKIIPGVQKTYGVKTPVLNDIARRFSPGSFALAEDLWNAGALEEKIIAIKIMERKGKEDPNKLLKLFQKFSGGIDNWAVCDGMGMQFLRGVVKTHADEIFKLANKFNRSKEMWKRRLSLVMVEWYTRLPQFHPQIEKLLENLKNDDEYYVKKGVAWIRKNLAKGK